MPLCNIHGLDNKFKELFDYINAKNINFPGLQEHVTNYIQHASNLCTLKQKHEGQSSVQNLKAQLSSLELCLNEIQQRRDEFRKELLQLDEDESQLSSLLASSEDSFQKHVTIVKDLTGSHNSLEKDITIAEEATMKLEETNKGLKDAHDLLKSFKWEP
ncbi:Kinesin-like protein KIFC1 [Bienertia sinuspersici]